MAVVISSEDYQAIEELKLEHVKRRFSNINEDDLVDSDTFFEALESGKYDLDELLPPETCITQFL